MKKVLPSSQTATQGKDNKKAKRGATLIAKRTLTQSAPATKVAVSRVEGSKKIPSSKVTSPAAKVASSTLSKSKLEPARAAKALAGQTDSAIEAPVKKPARKRNSLGLSASQLRDLEKKLLELSQELKDALHGKAGSFNANTLNESIIKGDDAEVAEKQRMSNAALQELDFLKSRLRLVQRALVKMEAGAYGICEETEEPIGYERLSVVPWLVIQYTCKK